MLPLDEQETSYLAAAERILSLLYTDVQYIFEQDISQAVVCGVGIHPDGNRPYGTSTVCTSKIDPFSDRQWIPKTPETEPPKLKIPEVVTARCRSRPRESNTAT